MDDLTILLNETGEALFLYGFMFLLTLAIVITLHEFGHYLAARFCNVYIEQFAFGFGREIIGFGGGKFKTRWSICAFPIGGFVKLFGDVDPDNPVVWDKENECTRTLSPEELSVSFCTKPVWQRMFIVMAGPLINILLTLCIFISVFTIHGQASTPVIINALAMDAPAYVAGIEIGDHITHMDGKKIRRLEDIYDRTMAETSPIEHRYTLLRNAEKKEITFAAKYVQYTDKKGVDQAHGQTGMVNIFTLKINKDISSINNINTKDKPEKARNLILENFDRPNTIGLTNKIDADEKKQEEKFLITIPSVLNTHLSTATHKYYDTVFLVDPDLRYYVKLGVIESAIRSSAMIKNMVIDSYKLIKVAYKGRTDEPVIGGIGKISQHTAKAAEGGLYTYLMFVAGFSFMIAFINLLPIPVLDGGYMVFLLYEAIAKKPVSQRIQSLALIIGMVLLGGIMVFANISDLISMLNDIESK